jgi:Phosphatidylethanolamine-binding protein
MSTNGRAITPRMRGGLRPLLFSLWGALLFTLIAATQTGCTPDVTPQGFPSLELSSTSFSGGAIPKKYSCDGQEASPELSWKTPPERTQSFALLVTDRDSPFGYSFVTEEQ